MKVTEGDDTSAMFSIPALRAHSCCHLKIINMRFSPWLWKQDRLFILGVTRKEIVEYNYLDILSGKLKQVEKFM